MRTGVVLGYTNNIKEDFYWCVKNGIPTCQLSVQPVFQTREHADKISQAREETGIEITALIGTWSGPSVWNFYEGPLTLGIIPPAYRAMRLNELIRCADFAALLGVNDVCTHMGFIPEIPSDPLYSEFVAAARWLAYKYHNKGIRLNFETGQETPVTLLRVINDIGLDNVGVNFDPANLIMYGKANPIDALDIVGKFVNGVHAKDGEYPVDGKNLGVEKPLGEGRVNINAFISKLKGIGYDGPVTIEREISGEQQKADVLRANELLKALI